MPGFDRPTKQASQRAGRAPQTPTVQRAPSSGPGATHSHGSVLGLQRSIGNAATSAYLQRESSEEEEEESMQLSRMIQREAAEEEEEESMQLSRSVVQRAAEEQELEEEE